MKQSIQIIVLILFASFNSGCQAQYMMRTLSDAQKLKINEQQFVGKPLRNLLKEIQPPIKRVTANPISGDERLGNLRFSFVTPAIYDSLWSIGKYPLVITVFVKESFEWSLRDRPEKEKAIWTKNDAARLGDLTVLGIRVYGENY